eukprot:CAMPEP_0119051224 /NCGR_PEP_ID=MMETSP1177-20130426/72912_1 /TAXON_ID=2985 /ORGANISM="Ochromonas sp, Strain CCMP1899" /LENGTH=202 /DNA_ID=CAMNT_0007030355 /DNA_START=242 /DNA_END=848 /DNA_ORIENTATION=-
MSALKFGARAVEYDEHDDECKEKYREDPVDDIPVEPKTSQAFGARAVEYDEHDDECKEKYREDPVDDIPVETQNISISSIDDYENYRSNNVEISEVIDLEVWDSLDGETRNKVEANALSTLRPQGIEKDFWDTLEESVKATIIDSLKRKKIIDVKLESPEEVDPKHKRQKMIIDESPVCLPAWFIKEVVPTKNRSKRSYLKW